MHRFGLFVFTTFIALFFSQNIQANDVEYFLEKSADEIDEKYIFDNIRFYLNPHFKGSHIYWYNGSLISKKGEKYGNLKIKFNTVANTLNLKYRGLYYRVSAKHLKEFTIQDDGKERLFRRGFSKGSDHMVTANYGMQASGILQYISGFTKMEDFYSIEINTNQKEVSNTLGSIELKTKNTLSITAFESYLKNNEDISNITVTLGERDGRQSIFFEVLAERDGISFLKRHSKILSKNETGAVLKEVNNTTMTNNSFYLSDRNNHLQKIYANKKSVVNGLEFSGLKYEGKVPTILTEKKLVEVLVKII